MNADLAEYYVPVNADVPSMDVLTVEDTSACERARHQGVGVR
jgi:CO/xanthine dehydrogenase Mo-binding subunit